MTDIENASPAGESDGASAPMTIDAAASMIAGWEDEPEQTTEQPTEVETQASDEPELPSGDEDGQQSEENTTPEDQPQGFDWDKVPGDAKFRLRDGTEVTAADLKRDFDDLRQARSLREEYENSTRQFHHERSRFAQEAQQFAQIAPIAIAALKASVPEVPPLPGDELLDDPMAYQQALHRHNQALMVRNQKIGQIQAIEQAARIQQAQVQQAEQAQKTQYIQEQQQLLTQKMPQLRDPAKLNAFVGDVQRFGTEVYGFTPEELDIVDHRVVQVIADAIAFRKLQTSPPKPVGQQQRPTSAAPAVAAPGKRVGQGEANGQKRDAVLQNVRRTGGSIDSVAAAIAALDL